MISSWDLPEHELDFSAIRAGGPGGQHVNKVSSAIHLRFDIKASSLSDYLKLRLAQLQDHRATADGIIVIKAQTFRSQEKNRADAMARLDDLFRMAQYVKKTRKVVRPSKAQVRRRVDTKRKLGDRKRTRGKIDFE